MNDLWRVCRVISHERRLHLLWILFEKNEATVTQLAADTCASIPNASIQLKTLYMAGLVRFRRQDMNVIYRVEANARIKCADRLLNSLRECFERGVTFESVARQATGFTHERRIELIIALSEGALSFEQLGTRSQMKSSALARHLSKLESREFVRWDGMRYHVGCAEGVLGKALLNVVSEGGSR